MKNTLKHLENSEHKEFFSKQIEGLSDAKKIELENLIMKFENAGAKNPLNWALSEITESIPQFSRFLVLKSLFDIAQSVDENLTVAEYFDTGIKASLTEIKEKTEQEKIYKLLNSYSKGIIYRIIGMLDEGNPKSDSDKRSWLLIETDEFSEPTGQIIQGLHENFSDFEKEVI